MDDNLKKIILITSTTVFLIIVVLILLLLLEKPECSDELILNDKNIVINVDEYKLIDYEVCKDSNKKIIFESVNSSIAKVDNQGYVKGIIAGETDIILKYENSKIEEKCHVIVTAKVEKEEQPTEETANSNETASKPQTSKKITPTCKLSVSSDGIITAKVTKALKYSFDKKLLSNETQKSILDITDKEVKDYEGWKYYRINYYVESETNTKKTCSIIVVEKCNNNQCVYETY